MFADLKVNDSNIFIQRSARQGSPKQVADLGSIISSKATIDKLEDARRKLQRQKKQASQDTTVRPASSVITIDLTGEVDNQWPSMQQMDKLV